MPTPIDPPTLRLALNAAKELLAEGPHPARAWRDAETLMVHALAQYAPAPNLAWLIAHESDPIATDVAKRFCDAIERRLAGEPIQYIIGECEFYGLPFHVNGDVLIPRPETELLVERAAHFAPLFRKPRVVDVGTGSGAIAVAIAHQWPDAIVTATDVSAAALDMARTNAERNGFAQRIRFLEGDLLAPVAGEHFDLVVSNPPYVPHSDRNTLDMEVRNYEPPQALFAGEDGLAIYRRLLPEAFKVLVVGGILLLEIGHGQQESIQALLEKELFTEIECTADLQGIPRVVTARRS